MTRIYTVHKRASKTRTVCGLLKLGAQRKSLTRQWEEVTCQRCADTKGTEVWAMKHTPRTHAHAHMSYKAWSKHIKAADSEHKHSHTHRHGSHTHHQSEHAHNHMHPDRNR